MNWRILRIAPWLDTRANVIARIPRGGALLDIGSSDGETLRHFLSYGPICGFSLQISPANQRTTRRAPTSPEPTFSTITSRGLTQAWTPSHACIWWNTFPSTAICFQK